MTGSIAADGQTPITGQLKAVTGTALVPSYSFSSDTSTGFHHTGAGVVAYSGEGTDVIVFDESQYGTTDNVLYYFNGALPCPVGLIQDWPGTSAPTGWQLLYGQVLSQETYPGLFAVVGTTYNTGGEGADNFRLPDMRGRVGAGKDDMGGTAANRLTSTTIDGTILGNSGGAQTFTLTTTQLPNSGLNFLGSNAGLTVRSTVSDILVNPSALQSQFGAGSSGFGIPTGSVGGVQITSTSSAFNVTGTTDPMGSGGATPIVQPTIIFNKIIFAGRP